MQLTFLLAAGDLIGFAVAGFLVAKLLRLEGAKPALHSETDRYAFVEG